MEQIGIKTDGTQENRVLSVLQEARGEWISGEFFLRQLYLSQYHRAIWNLQNKRERYWYVGYIEASDFKNEHNFKSYRLVGDYVPEKPPQRNQNPLAH